EVYQYFAKILALRFDDKAEYWLNQALVLPGGEEIIDYGIRHALRSHDWKRVKRWLAMTPQAERGSNQWRYWEAKSDQFIGEFALNNTDALNQKSPSISTTLTLPLPLPLSYTPTSPTPGSPFQNLLKPHSDFIYNLTLPDNTRTLLPNITISLFKSLQTPVAALSGLSQERSFYGFISSELLNKPLQLNHQLITPSNDQITRVLSTPGIVRARELYQIKEETYARSEWNLAITRMPAEDRGIAAQLADQWGWHHHAIMAAARSDIRDNLTLRFPTAYQNTVTSNASKNGIAKDWVFSLIRQESAFSYQAKSPVGALGMMQIMPATAKQISKNMGIRYKGKYSLLQPEKNIQLGTRYMGQLLKRFQGNTILATAAYNAGPSRAKRWQPKHTPMAGDIWIETIPYKETRNYVKNVMTYQAIYRSHLGQDIKLAKSLISVPARYPQLVRTIN
ncbi:MAG: transglycosylase SLT domain-containing protein, partial [Pseudomonadales bacterium]|nr:transglycosylase SLT domain-containing protein [Pseudomonadales bacterium]